MYKSNRPRLFVLIAVLLFALPLFPIGAFAQSSSYSFSILHTFADDRIDGATPESAPMLSPDGNFYGTTAYGGSWSGHGTAYSMTRAGVLTILHSFGSSSIVNDGDYIVGGLTLGLDGNFYGTTAAGGNANYGTVFKITPDGTTSLLYSFSAGSVPNDGNRPIAGLTLGLDGNFYGVTAGEGGVNKGTVFKITPEGAFINRHVFRDGSVANDGADPSGSLTLGADGNFYGTTFAGGSGNNGTVFKMTPAGATTILHLFVGGANDGRNPQAGLTISPDGNFYGTTIFGGLSNKGTIFKMTPAGTVTILHHFAGGENDGSSSSGSLTYGPDGNFYGTTTYGGSAVAADPSGLGFGIVFKITPAGVFSILHKFAGGVNDGSLPYGGVSTDSNGNLYGGTALGGDSKGLLYRLTTVHLVVSATTNVLANSAVNFTVTALNSDNQPATYYSGPIHFTSTDPQAILPDNVTLINGMGSFSATLKSVGIQTITAADTMTPPITASSNNINVTPQPAKSFRVICPETAMVGTPLTFTVNALDADGNSTTGYTGTVHFTSTDPQAILPTDATLTNGTGAFSATLKSSSNRTITATDTITLSTNGTSANINVSPGTADHLSMNVPDMTIAGISFSVVVTAQDAYNNTVSNYTGTVHFTSTDPRAILPTVATLTNGTGIFGVTLVTAGSRIITATDIVNSNIAGTTGGITVNPGTVGQYLVTAPSTSSAGTALSVSIIAKDVYGNTVIGYTGTAHFTSTDFNALLPVDTALTNGTGSFNATLITAGSQTITVTDTVTPSITGTSGTVAVAPAAVTHFGVGTPSVITAGTAFNVTVTARDQFNNLVSSYNGMALFASSCPGSLPSGVMVVNGACSASVSLNTTGSQFIAVFDMATFTIAGSSGYIQVNAAPAAKFVITAPSAATAGSPTAFTVKAITAIGDPATAYSGTVHFISTDPAATLPVDTTLTNGTGTFSAMFRTAMSATLQVQDTVDASVNGAATLNIASAAFSHLTISSPATAAIGAAINVTITARDQFENATAGYTGTLHLTSTDAMATLPANFAFTGVSKQVSVTLRTSGSQTIKVTDIVNAGLTATTNNINVGPATAKLVIAAATTAIAGSSLTFTVTAKDTLGNTVPGYTGTAHITSTDTNAILPADATLTNGVGTFSITFRTATTVTISATDTVTSTIKGSSGGIVVSAAPASLFTVTVPASIISGTAFYATVTAKDAYGNLAKGYTGSVHFTSTDSLAVLSANVTLTNGTKQVSVKLKTPGNQTVTATDTANTGITGTSSMIAVN